MKIYVENLLMEDINIILCEEEIEGLLEGKEICVYEDEDREVKITIKTQDSKRNALRTDILSRYDNENYWDSHILNESDDEYENEDCL